MNDLIKYPVEYEPMGIAIFDADFNRVCDVRGWGRLLYMENPEEKQNSIGRFIANAINEKLKKNKQGKNKMKLHEFIEKKHKLESAIVVVVQSLINQFGKETEVQISEVNIKIINNYKINNFIKISDKAVIMDCKVELNI